MVARGVSFHLSVVNGDRLVFFRTWQAGSLHHVEMLTLFEISPHETTPLKPASHAVSQRWQSMPPSPGWRCRPFLSIAFLGRKLLCLVCLIAILAVLAAIPVANLYAMGFLLGAQERIARTGRFREAFILLPAASRLVGMAMATTVCLLLVAWLAGVVREAWLISSGSFLCWLLTGVLILFSTVMAAHVSGAILLGGTFWQFLRPDRSLRRLLSFSTADPESDQLQSLSGLLPSLEIGQNIRTGIRSYVAVCTLLALPAWMYTSMQDPSRTTQRVLFVSGAVLLTLMLGCLPFVQVHLAVRGRLIAVIDYRSVMQHFRNAPGSYLLAVLVLFGLSSLVPLYQALFKLKLPPNSILWDVMLVTIVVTLPGRFLTAWAYHRGGRTSQSHRIWQWLCIAAILVATATYLGFLMLAAGSGQLGSPVIWQHHELLLPLPF